MASRRGTGMAAADNEAMICPFCAFEADGDYQIMLHMETAHPEDEAFPLTAPVNASDHASKTKDGEGLEMGDGTEGDEYVACPREGCGEALLLRELDSHVEMHEEEGSTTSSSEVEMSEGSSRGSKRVKLQGKPTVDSNRKFDMSLPHPLRNLEEASSANVRVGRDGLEGESEKDRDRREMEFYNEVYGDRKAGPKPNGSERKKERRQAKSEPESSSTSRLDIAKAAWRELLRMPPVERKASPANATLDPKPKRQRLGKAELGPYAYEKQMPTWLVNLLEEEDGATEIVTKVDRNGETTRKRWCPNMTGGIIPVLEQLLNQSEGTDYAFLCNPGVKHVSKLKKEGGFCGYRNIQMMSSYIIDAQTKGHEVFKGKIPSIFRIQDYIENAWDLGINSQGRIETGGVKGTRKYIGTPEAQAMFCRLDIACDAQGLKPTRDSGINAYELLFKTVEEYFMNGNQEIDQKVRCTGLPPIYFQHPGHSMTIIGFERKVSGSRNLLVFDPMFHDAWNVAKLVGERFRHRNPEDLLKAYRRNSRYLKRYHEFELLKLTQPPVPRVSSRASSTEPRQQSQDVQHHHRPESQQPQQQEPAYQQPQPQPQPQQYQQPQPPYDHRQQQYEERPQLYRQLQPQFYQRSPQPQPYFQPPPHYQPISPRPQQLLRYPPAVPPAPTRKHANTSGYRSQ